MSDNEIFAQLDYYSDPDFEPDDEDEGFKALLQTLRHPQTNCEDAIVGYMRARIFCAETTGRDPLHRAQAFLNWCEAWGLI